jgi:multiple sugar transport system ATP-binding protein
MATITLERLTKVYPNGFEAVHALDLAVTDGEFMVLVGPSGCGKTTALRMVAGLEKISSGTLRIGGEVVNDVSPRDRDIAMVFQNYALYPHMTVAQNIAFALQMRRLRKREIDEKVARVAAILGLTGQLGHKPAQLSGGQRQRVAMGRAIIREPAAFLMDEPLSNLDAKLRVQMRAEVSRIQRRVGVATLYVTHDQTEAMTMGDRVAVLRSGSLQQCDAPQKLYDEPVNLFVAAFIGSPAMNLYEARLAPDGSAVSLGSQEIPLPAQLSIARPGLAAHRGQAVVAGIRPEHLSAPAGGGQAVLRADVELVEALGSELLVHYRVDARRVHAEEAEDIRTDGAAHSTGPGELVEAALAEGVARLDPRTAVKPGDRFDFAVDPAQIHFFDGSGQAIWH